MNNMTEAEKWGEYDIATQALSIIISDYSERMYLEEKKGVPDQELIKKWLDEQNTFFRLKRSLRVDDEAASTVSAMAARVLFHACRALSDED